MQIAFGKRQKSINKEIEEALKESELKFRTLAETTSSGIIIYQDEKIVYINPAITNITGYEKAEALKKKFWETVHPDFQHIVKERGIARQKGESVPKEYEFKIMTKDGVEKWIRLNAGQIILGGRPAGVATVTDITNYKKIEAELQHRIEFKRLISAISTNFIHLMPNEIDNAFNRALRLLGEFAKANRCYIFLFHDNLRRMENTHEWCRDGIRPNIDRSKNVSLGSLPWFGREMKKRKVIYITDILKLTKSADAERKYFQANGARSVISVPMIYGKVLVGFLGFEFESDKEEWAEDNIALFQIAGEVFVNAIEHREEENLIRASERKYRTLFEDSRDAIYMTTKDGKVLDINQAGLLLLGYTRDEILGTNVRAIYVNSSERNRFQEIINKQGAVKNYEVKLRHKNGSAIDCLVTSTVMLSIEGNIVGYQGIIRDITKHKEAENYLKESCEKLARIMNETVSALATTTEKRDPYTAGHQQRVAQLAYEIGMEMGLQEETIEGIRVAGVLHDIGKICVPTEILNKPAALNKIEFDIIKTHPQASHDIVKTIEFPWPIAQILYQHHERINGSGYPLGLKEDKILLEAKIIAVADVIEAMMSNRPYRQALSLEEALDEIIKNRGILYSSKVVDVCIKIFKENKFIFR